MSTIAVARESTNQSIFDQAILRAIEMERYKAAEVTKMLKFLDEEVLPSMVEKLKKRLKKIGVAKTTKEAYSVRRIKEQITEVTEVLRVGIHKADSRLKKKLIKRAISEAEWQGAAIRAATPSFQLTWNLPTVQKMNLIINAEPFQGKLLSEWADTIPQSAQRDLIKKIRIGMVEGTSSDVLARQLIDTTFKDIRNHTATYVRTSVQYVNNAARQASYEANSDIISKILYVATLDHRTTIICASLDGQKFPVDEGPRPPQHLQCRSTTVPILKKWNKMPNAEELPKVARVSLTGSPPAETTYPQWLKRQTPEIQNQVLGKKRAIAFREGEPISKFVSRKGDYVKVKPA